MFRPPLRAASRESSDELLHRVRMGDALAFEKLYYRMFPAVRSFISSRNCPKGLIDDIAQEVFCRAWQWRGRFRGQAAVKTYLFGMALNVIREFRRDGGRMVQLAHPTAAKSQGATGCDILEGEEMTQTLIRARSALPPEQSQALTLIYDEQLTPREAARQVGCTEKAMRRRIENGRQKMRRFLRGKM